MPFDTTGKISFDDIYIGSDPRPYFDTLGRVDYQIPQLAKPYFTKLIEECRDDRQIREPSVLDVGCSYGVNALLQRCDLTMDDLYEHYTDPDALATDRNALLDRDRRLVHSRAQPRNARFTGLDSSEPALRYALSAGFLDDAIHADLEQCDPTGEQKARLADVDLVMSTGCLGYVTERTVRRIADAARGQRPWMAHFVLRMFSYEPVEASLAELGYETVSIEGVFKQRRFASWEEQTFILDTLSTVGVDSRGLEADGWLYAQLFVSRPSAGRK